MRNWIGFWVGLLLLIPDIFGLGSCQVCHLDRAAELLNRHEVFESWRTLPRQQWRGHMFLNEEDLKSLQNPSKSTPSVTGPDWFERFESALASRNTSFLHALVLEGKQDTPGLMSTWELLSEALDTAFFSKVERISRALAEPFFHLEMGAGSTLEYSSESRVWASRIWPVFPGFRRKGKVEYSFETNAVSASGYEGNLIYSGLNEKGEEEWSAEANYFLEPTGRVQRLKWVHEMPIPSGMKNASGIFERGLNLNTLTGEKTIWLGKTPLKRDSVVLNMKFEPQKVEEGPVLIVGFNLSEKPDDSKDSVRIAGKGTVRLNWCGQVMEVKSRVEVKFRLLGLNLVSGGSEDHVKMLSTEEGSTCYE